MNIEQAIKLNVIHQVKLQGLESEFTQGKTKINAFLVNGQVLEIFVTQVIDIKGNKLEVETWEVKEGECGFADAIGGYFSEGVPDYIENRKNKKQ